MGNITLNNIKLGKKGSGLNIDNLVMPLNSIIGIVGGKGCGKTDLVGLLTGKIKLPNGSSVVFDDGIVATKDIYEVNSKTYLNAYFSIRDYMDKMEREYPNFSRELALKCFNAMEMPIAKINYRHFDRMAQCAINCIFAIASRSKVTIFDQPCRDLPLKLREILYTFAKEDFEEYPRTFIITSNIAVDVDKIVKHVVYLRKNRVVFNMPYEDVDKFAIGLLGKKEMIDTNIKNLEVFYTSDKADGLVQKIVRNDIPFENMQALNLNGVISQYVNLVNFHTYVIKEDFGFEEAAREKAEQERLAEEKKANRKNKNKNVAIIAKDDAGATASSTPKEEKKETFGEKVKRILTSDIF